MIANIALIAGGGVVALLVGLLVYAATRPNAFRVQRSATVPAPPEAVYGRIADFHHWPDWSPWEKIDPNMKRTHAGPESGPGASYEWEGNKKVGRGRMTITDASRPSRVTIQLDFLKPFEAHHTVEFTLEPNSTGTHVTWAMFGRQPYLFKVMTLFFNMDRAVGRDFEKGLANLRTLVRQAPAAA